MARKESPAAERNVPDQNPASPVDLPATPSSADFTVAGRGMVGTAAGAAAAAPAAAPAPAAAAGTAGATFATPAAGTAAVSVALGLTIDFSATVAMAFSTSRALPSVSRPWAGSTLMSAFSSPISNAGG